MANQSRVDSDLLVLGNIACESINLPTGTVGNDEIEAAAGIDASKLEHQISFGNSVDIGTAIGSDTSGGYIAHAAGELLSFQAATTGTAATGADRTLSINILRSTAGGAFSTMLAGSVTFGNTDSICVVKEASLGANINYIAGDILVITRAVAGAAGAQAKGLAVAAHVREAAD